MMLKDWDQALDTYDDVDSNWWLNYNSEEFMIYYQYNENITNRLKVVSGFDYEFKFPKTKNEIFVRVRCNIKEKLLDEQIVGNRRIAIVKVLV